MIFACQTLRFVSKCRVSGMGPAAKDPNAPRTLNFMAMIPGLRKLGSTLLVSTFLILPASGVEYGQVAYKVANLLQHEHYNDQRIDDNVSRQLLENYLDFLDIGRLYFLQKDIDRFKAQYETRLDNKLLQQDISPALDIYYVYTDHVVKRVEWIKTLLDKEKFSFDSNRKVQISRKELPWPANPQEANKVWYNIIEGEMLQEVLRQDAAEEKAAEKGKPLEEPLEDPAVVVRKRYERILDSLKGNTTEDIAGFFLKSLAHTYDPHSDYFTQSEYNNFRISMKKQLTGIGALLSMTDEGYAEIRGLVVGGPAHQAGELQVGDRIIGVGQKASGSTTDIMHMKLQKVVDLIRGPKSSIVRLKVIPAGKDSAETTVIQIKRDTVDLKESIARAEMIETTNAAGEKIKLGWIDLPSFYSDMETGQTSVTKDTDRLLRRLKREGMQGLVIDLRENGGGSLEEAINLTGLFIRRGPVVQSKDSRNAIDVKNSPARNPVYEGPLVVLTSKSSASASEILAAALQDYNRAVIVGEQSTFGKGTVQQLLPVTTSGFSLLLPGNSNQAGALKLTIQKFYRIAGGSTQQKGVIPDLILPSITDAMELGEASLNNPLPYDEIAAKKFALFNKDKLPIGDLRVRSQARLNQDPDFKWIIAETERYRERRKRNSVPLNREERVGEIDEQEARVEARKQDLIERYTEIKKQEKDLFTTYSITLQDVDKPELRLLSDLSAADISGMMTDAKRDKTDEEKALETPHGYGPVKREALEVLKDLIDGGGRNIAASETKTALPTN